MTAFALITAGIALIVGGLRRRIARHGPNWPGLVTGALIAALLGAGLLDALPGSEPAAHAAPTPPRGTGQGAWIHGDDQARGMTALYLLFDRDTGEFLKFGTTENGMAGRYNASGTKVFDKREGKPIPAAQRRSTNIEAFTVLLSSTTGAKAVEQYLYDHVPGPYNNEKGRGKQAGRLSAQRVAEIAAVTGMDWRSPDGGVDPAKADALVGAWHQLVTRIAPDAIAYYEQLPRQKYGPVAANTRQILAKIAAARQELQNGTLIKPLSTPPDPQPNLAPGPNGGNQTPQGRITQELTPAQRSDGTELPLRPNKNIPPATIDFGDPGNNQAATVVESYRLGGTDIFDPTTPVNRAKVSGSVHLTQHEWQGLLQRLFDLLVSGQSGEFGIGIRLEPGSFGTVQLLHGGSTGIKAPAGTYTLVHTHPYGIAYGNTISAADVLYLRSTPFTHGYLMEHSSTDPTQPATIVEFDRSGNTRTVLSTEVITPTVVAGYHEIGARLPALRRAQAGLTKALSAIDQQAEGEPTAATMRQIDFLAGLRSDPELQLISRSGAMDAQVAAISAKLKAGAPLTAADRAALRTYGDFLGQQLTKQRKDIAAQQRSWPRDNARAEAANAYLNWLIDRTPLPKYLDMAVTEDNNAAAGGQATAARVLTYHNTLVRYIDTAVRMTAKLMPAGPQRDQVLDLITNQSGFNDLLRGARQSPSSVSAREKMLLNEMRPLTQQWLDTQAAASTAAHQVQPQVMSPTQADQTLTPAASQGSAVHADQGVTSQVTQRPQPAITTNSPDQAGPASAPGHLAAQPTAERLAQQQAGQVADQAPQRMPAAIDQNQTQVARQDPRSTIDNSGQDNTAADQCNCFPAGTPVATVRGQVPIEDIRMGDQVWAHDLTTGKTELRTVTALFHRQADEMLTLNVAGVQVQVTPDHLFWVPGRGWVAAGQLRPGDQLQRRDGTVAVLRGSTERAVDTTVYNFTVAGDHDYYVSDAQLLVHNCGITVESTPRYDSNGVLHIDVTPPSDDPRAVALPDQGGNKNPRIVDSEPPVSKVETPSGSTLAEDITTSEPASNAVGVAADAIQNGVTGSIISGWDPTKLLMNLVATHDQMLRITQGDGNLASADGYRYINGDPTRQDEWNRVRALESTIDSTITQAGDNSAYLRLLYDRMVDDPSARSLADTCGGELSKCTSQQTSSWAAAVDQARNQEIATETIKYGDDPLSVARPITDSSGQVIDVVDTRTGKSDPYLTQVYRYRKGLAPGTSDQVVAQVDQLRSQLAAWGVPAGQITPDTLAAALSTYQTRVKATGLYSTTASQDTTSFHYDPSMTWLQNYTQLQNKIQSDTRQTISQAVTANTYGLQHGVEVTGPAYGTTSDFTKGLQTSDAMRQADVQTQLLTGLQLSQQGDIGAYAMQQGNAAAVAKLKAEGIDVQVSPDGKSYTVHLKAGQGASTVAKAKQDFTSTAQTGYDNTQTQFEQNYVTALQALPPLPGETKAEYAQRIHDAAAGMTKDHKPASAFKPMPVYVKSNADNNTTGPDTVQPGDVTPVQKQIAADIAHRTGDNNPLYTIDKGARDDPNPVGNVNAPGLQPKQPRTSKQVEPGASGGDKTHGVTKPVAKPARKPTATETKSSTTTQTRPTTKQTTRATEPRPSTTQTRPTTKQTTRATEPRPSTTQTRPTTKQTTRATETTPKPTTTQTRPTTKQTTRATEPKPNLSGAQKRLVSLNS